MPDQLVLGMYQGELRPSMHHILISMLFGLTFAASAFGQDPGESQTSDQFSIPLEPAKPASNRKLIEEFTAETLQAGDIKIGSDLEFGMTDNVMIGTDVVAMALGVSTLQAKYKINEGERHQFALGLRTAYLNGKTLLWGSVNDHFDKLDARIVRPSLAWSHNVSSRLKIHTFWAKGFGKINAKLSEKGRRRLWESKHPGDDYENRDKDTQEPTAGTDNEDPANPDEPTDTTSNQEKEAGKKSSISQQSIQVQSIAGLAQERFQLSGEFSRKNGNKILVSSRIEQSQFEELKSKFFRLTAAHHWIWTKFQMRLGVGVQYYVVSGNDLDGEKIDEAGIGPASDIVFYWIL